MGRYKNAHISVCSTNMSSSKKTKIQIKETRGEVQVLMAVSMNITVFRDSAPYSLVETD
jgi:hypothetical protein